MVRSDEPRHDGEFIARVDCCSHTVERGVTQLVRVEPAARLIAYSDTTTFAARAASLMMDGAYMGSVYCPIGVCLPDVHLAAA